MAKNEPEKKPRWYKLIAQAYKVTAQHDKLLLPFVAGAILLVLGVAVAIGLAIGGTAALVYSIIFGLLFSSLAGLFTLTRRFEKNAFARMEGSLGGSISVAQTIRRGWAFDDEPISVDPRGKSVVFQGVGKAGVMLLAEGGSGAKKQVDAVHKRVSKLVPGVPIHVIYVGAGANEIPLRNLVKAIRKHKKKLSKREREAVRARLRAIGGQRLPVPKGIDPMRARPNRKAMRG
jgi:hypothetical protein